MTLLDQTIASIQSPDTAIADRVQRLLDGKTKPPRSLGRLEDLACWIAGIQGTTAPEISRKIIVLMAADHGVASEGVSAYPQSVTGQMLRNFAAGGAAVCVLARHAGAEIQVVDMGVREAPAGLPAIKDRRLGSGTQNFTRGPAMSRETALRGLEIGVRLAGELAREGFHLVGLGEMGIGNTTAASAVAAALLGLPPEAVTGRGTGVDEAGWRRKLAVIARALEVNRPNPDDAVDVLSKVGGFELAGLAGLTLGCAAAGLPVLVDGFITSVAALAAIRLAPPARDYLEASHGSVEPGHRPVMDALGRRPLLDLDMRLGEGTGAALAMNLADAAVKILREMATFESAGVSRSAG
jgi:nicotinate-nucleotide--dimethylbenzimidazole phosphoribosyltransferase